VRAIALSRDLSVAQAKAATLIEALPWLARFHGARITVMSDVARQSTSPRSNPKSVSRPD